MIGSGLKKLAQEYGMQINNGIAYGNLGGFNATLSEGAGTKYISFATAIADPAKERAFITQIDARNLRKEFRVTRLNATSKYIQVTFHDNPGTMAKIRAFLDWFLPLLREAEAAGADICPCCGCEMTEGSWKLIGNIAYRMHDVCGEKVRREITESEAADKEERQGSYLTGLVGALLGSTLGGVLWAVVLYFGYIASIVGFAIGWLAEKGYDLLKGKQGKGKIAILIIAVIFGVLIGNFGVDGITLAQMIAEGYFGRISYANIPLLIVLTLIEEPEYRSAVIGNIVMGLVFAALGVWSLIRKANAEVSGTKIVDLK